MELSELLGKEGGGGSKTGWRGNFVLLFACTVPVYRPEPPVRPLEPNKSLSRRLGLCQLRAHSDTSSLFCLPICEKLWPITTHN